jgi:hypothetical protein
VSRSLCRRVVDTYWHLCGQPFFLPVSHILLKTLCLPPVFWSMFLFSFLINSSVAAAWAWAVKWSLHIDILQQFIERLLTVRRSCSLWKIIPVLHCPYCKRVFSDVRPSKCCCQPIRCSSLSCTDSIMSACCCEQFFASAIADEFVHKAHVLLDSSGLQCLKARFCTSFLITFSFFPRPCLLPSSVLSPVPRGLQPAMVTRLERQIQDAVLHTACTVEQR